MWDKFQAVTIILLRIVAQPMALKCYSCSYSRLEPTRANDDYFCANETLILMDKELTQRPCAAWEKYCVVCVNSYFYT